MIIDIRIKSDKKKDRIQLISAEKSCILKKDKKITPAGLWNGNSRSPAPKETHLPKIPPADAVSKQIIAGNKRKIKPSEVVPRAFLFTYF